MVAVIGDASTDPAGAKAVAARQVGALIIERRWRLVTGGMGGIMKEASAGGPGLGGLGGRRHHRHCSW